MSNYQSKVLMIGWEYPPHNSGGLGVACEGITQALALNNQQIYFTLPYAFKGSVNHMQVLSCFDPDWFSQKSTQPPFTAYQSPVKLVQEKEPLDSHQLRSLPQSDIEYKVDQYADLVQKQADRLGQDFELIHAHDWMSFPAAIQVKAKTNKPLVAHVHSTEYDRIPNGQGSPYIQATEKQGLEIADKVVAVSYYTKRLLVEKYQINQQKIEVVHNGVEPLPYSPQLNKKDFASKRPIVSFMGRLTNQKGAEFFIRVSQRVLAKFPQVLFILAGSGHLYHELLLQTADQNLTAKTLFSGFVRGQQKRKLLERTDVFVMPSLSEPFGLVALEAAQHHTPVIVSKNSGVSEIMTHSIQVDFWDEKKMAHEIIKLLKDQGYLQTVVKGQNQDLEQATWSNSVKKLEQVYRSAFLG